MMLYVTCVIFLVEQNCNSKTVFVGMLQSFFDEIHSSDISLHWDLASSESLVLIYVSLVL